MRALFNNRLLRFFSYVLSAFIILSPMAHASYMSLLNTQTEHAMHEMQPDCVQIDYDKTSESCHTLPLDTADVTESCEQDGSSLSCKLLCTVSISIAPNASIDNFIKNKTHKWLSHQTNQQTQSFSITLFKPPRI